MKSYFQPSQNRKTSGNSILNKKKPLQQGKTSFFDALQQQTEKSSLQSKKSSPSRSLNHQNSKTSSTSSSQLQSQSRPLSQSSLNKRKATVNNIINENKLLERYCQIV
jgi:hypothetical protein